MEIVGKGRFAIIVIIMIFVILLLARDGVTYFVDTIVNDVGAQVEESYSSAYQIIKE